MSGTRAGPHAARTRTPRTPRNEPPTRPLNRTAAPPHSPNTYVNPDGYHWINEQRPIPYNRESPAHRTRRLPQRSSARQCTPLRVCWRLLTPLLAAQMWFALI